MVMLGIDELDERFDEKLNKIFSWKFYALVFLSHLLSFWIAVGIFCIYLKLKG